MKPNRSPEQTRIRVRLLIIFFSMGGGACIMSGFTTAVYWFQGLTPQDVPGFLSNPLPQLGAIGLLLALCWYFVSYFRKKADAGDADRIAEKNQTIADREKTIADREKVIEDQRVIIDHLKVQNRSMAIMLERAGLKPPTAPASEG